MELLDARSCPRAVCFVYLALGALTTHPVELETGLTAWLTDTVLLYTARCDGLAGRHVLAAITKSWWS
jgi:hypothetical protein